MLSRHISEQIRQQIGFELTADQELLVANLGNYLVDPDNSVIFVLTGYAGTGKTTVVGAVVRTLKTLDQQVVLLAPTGRAAKVMSLYAGVPAYTIHKRIYRQAHMRDGVGEFKLNVNLMSNTVFIVDEASMISNSSYEQSVFGSGRLLDDLVRFVRQGVNCRLILVGDSAQLPPVGLDISPALDGQFLSGYGRSEQVFLSQVVRQAQDSGILYNATRIRQSIETKNKAFPKLLLQFPDIERLSGADFVETFAAAYNQYGAGDTMVITRSNKQANRYNAGIRAMILGKEEELVAGDRLMVVKNSYSWVEKDPELLKELDFIANGDIVEVVKIKKHLEMYGLRFADVIVSLPDYKNMELDCRLVLDTLSQETAALPSAQGKALFADVFKDYQHITTAVKRYAAVKSDPYFSALQVKHAYAITCHKAQGGQWKTVFIDHGYLTPDMMNVEFQRWLYTAITRATDKVYLVNFDNQFFNE